MKCSKCKKEFEEKDIHEHHIHPRFMDNKKGDDIKIYLCKKHHDILHLKIPALYWDLLTKEQKEKAAEITKKYSLKYGGLNDTNAA